MDSFRDFLHPTKSLKPVKKMLLQELMHLAIVTKPTSAFLKMLEPVETCILNLKRKTALNSTALNFSYKRTGRV